MITVDMSKAKEIGHDIRRQRRAAEFAPLDQAIAAQIPGVDASVVEAERKATREKYDHVQAAIDAAEDVDEIKLALAATK